MNSAAGIQVQTLEKHYEMFKRSVDCNKILGKLRMYGMISLLDMQRLQAEKTQMERNRFLFTSVNYTSCYVKARR